jgi:hypothetical protein
MTKPRPAAEFIALPADLSGTLRAHGYEASLAIVRCDGAPLTDKDRATLPLVLENYETIRELQPTADELVAAVTQMNAQARQGHGGE